MRTRLLSMMPVRDEYQRAHIRLRYRTALRYAQISVIGIACFVGVMALSMVAGCFLSDTHIDRNYATTYALVGSVDAMHTYVSFVDRSGKVVNPNRGVLYPTGVHEGQRVRVDYDHTNPNYVRISGRSWVLSIIPALSMLACVLPWAFLAFAVIGRLRLKAGGIIRRTHWKGTIAGIHVKTRPTAIGRRAAITPTTKQVV